MKKILSAIVPLAIVLSTQAQPFANRRLSNLLSPTAVNQDLLPNSTNTRDLGSSSLNWKDLYLGGSIFKGSLRFLSNQGTQNTFLGISAGNAVTTGSNNSVVGAFALLNNTTGSFNIAIGTSAMELNTTGSNNIAIGKDALISNITGSSNTAIGSNTLFHSTGSLNTATGAEALFSTTSGSFNTANGAAALLNNTIGSFNTAVGYEAMFHNTTGISNTATGYQALRTNNTGSNNTAQGFRALISNTEGSFNTATGVNALFGNARASYNTAYGYDALHANTGSNNTATGAEALRFNTADGNTAHGYRALFLNLAAPGNSAFGFMALSSNTGDRNTAVGTSALTSNTTGSANTAIGSEAGMNFTTSRCTFVGTQAESAAAGFSNSTALGYQATFTASDQVRVGNSAVTSIGGFADWTNFSDGRYKKNIKEDVPGLAFITQLKPITYTLDIEGLEKAMKANAPQMNTGAGKPVVQPELSQLETAAPKASAKEIRTGFVAQEVEAVAQKLNYSFNGVDAPKNDKDLYGLRYAEFVVPLVKAVQELDAENKKMKEEMKEFRQIVLDLMSSNTNNSSPRMNISGAYLKQNAPNPFNSTTIIRYNIPMESTSARLSITDMKGQLVKTISVSSKVNQVTLSGGELVAGSYVYSLWVDGKQVDSKRMILTK